MPLVAHNQLPAFEKLRAEGVQILDSSRAMRQHIRELHIGLLNMMPDAALKATEKQFFRLIADANPIAQFYVHPFTLDSIPRNAAASEHIQHYYESFDAIRAQGLDGLIITGANVIGPELSNQPFFEPLRQVVDWAYEEVTSTLCSCLATHAVLEFRYQQKRHPQKRKKWGVFNHQLTAFKHPLTTDINTEFQVPHSRWNAVMPEQFEAAGLPVLVTEKDDGCVHLATSPDGFRQVFFQGHPEYDTISLLKEYKREINRYIQQEISEYPPFPGHYFGQFEQAILNEFKYRLEQAKMQDMPLPDFPEHKLLPFLKNSWCDTADAVVGNWLGLIYQLTHKERKKPFMDPLDPLDPLGLLKNN